jgi:signal transduction histidine kinase
MDGVANGGLKGTESSEALELRNETPKPDVEALKDQLDQRVKERTLELEQEKVRAETADATKTAFLASMSHEIRAPMSGLLGMAELLELTELDDKQKLYLQTLKQSGETMMAVVNDILDFTKLYSGETGFEQGSFELTDLLESAARPFRDSVFDEVELTVEVDPRLNGFYQGGASRLKQIISNLLSNAVKFTHVGRIRVTAELLAETPQQHTVGFSVTDTGIGISAEQMEKIFQPFIQTDASATQRYGGSGLGLSICKKIVDLMDGDIGVESSSADGSSFWVTVPLALGDESLFNTPLTDIDYDYSILRVLMVEDNAVNQLLGKGQLNKLGLDPVILEGGAEAVKAICHDKEVFDLVLMDCEMPGMDGFEATRLIRTWEKDNQRPATPVYAMTAQVLPENSHMCMQAGMDGKLTKPVAIKDYRSVLDFVLEKVAVRA